MTHSTMLVVTNGRYSWRCSCGVEVSAGSIADALTDATTHRADV